MVLFFLQLTKHWEDECTECEMTCPLNKLGGCNFKVFGDLVSCDVVNCDAIFPWVATLLLLEYLYDNPV